MVGPSGCGKSTLLELVCGLIGARRRARRAPAPAALMPQRDALLPWLSALDNAGLALRVAGTSRARRAPRAHEHFAAFGLEGFERARPAALSGGMRQRVAFLRTLLAGRPVLCLDEPFGALDALTRLQMQRWLADALAREPRTVLLVTHDVEEAVLLADRVVLLSPRPGRVVETLDVERAAPAAARRRAPWSSCASARCRRWGRRDRGARPARAARRLGGARPHGGVDPLLLPAPTQVPRRSGRTARCSRPTCGRRRTRSCSGCSRPSLAGAALAVAMHL